MEKRKVKSFSGYKTKKIVEEIRKIELQKQNGCIIAHAGSNDLFLQSNKVGNSEPLVKDLKCMVDTIAEKTTRGIVVGMLPRSCVSYHALSKAIGINERIKEHCFKRKVSFMDLWNEFTGKRQLFRKDGIHLNEAGQRRFGELLSRECERVVGTEENGENDCIEELPTPQVEDTKEDASCENSFIGFPKEN